MAIKIKRKKAKNSDESEEVEGTNPELNSSDNETSAPENELEREIEEGIVGEPDIFQATAVDTVDWASRHVPTIVVTVVIVILLGVSSYFLLAYLESRKTELSSELNPVFQANAALIKGSQEYDAIEAEKPKFTFDTFDSEQAREEAILKTALVVTHDASDDPITVPALLAEASANLKLSHPDKAEANYNRILELSSDDNVTLMANFGLAQAYIDQKKYEQAIKMLDTVGEKDKKIAQGLRLKKAKVYEAMGNTEEAKKLYHEILDDKSAGVARSDIERRLANL